jgi:hypothetical protein
MFELKLARLLGVMAVGSVSAGMLLASCTTPSFSFVDVDAGTDTLPHCLNAQRDEGESDVDCGGSCAPCALTQSCNTTADCKDSDCTDGTCQAAGCSDGAQTGTETDVDCGGGSCKPCAVSLGCVEGTDCQSGVCSSQACADPTCNDRVKNGDESDIDCGGTDCSSCIAGQGCLTPSDCVGNDCTAGKCALSCAAGTANCDGDAKNGCETNIRTDADHCGDCATACSLNNASATCSAGVCHVDTCTAPFADCDGDPKNGCEVNTKTDVANCGSCDSKPCPTLNGAAYCAESACQITCAKNFADCDGQSGNGCEKDVSRDVNNCGGCGTVCKPTKAGNTAWCRDGQCGESNCAPGRGDCNGDPDDDPANRGCETDFLADPKSCGSCGNICGVAGGVAECSNGACAIKSCTAPMADCTGGYKDGCETNVNTDIANCGSCTTACTTAGGTPQCALGKCQVKSCNAPNMDCNGTVADGCEINTSNNSSHCGSCTGPGTDCTTAFASATGHCASSACVFDGCGTDHLNCDTVLSNGCEVNYKTDTNHCGACGTSCATTNASSTSCNGGACVPICTAGHAACGSPQNGCAINTTTDAANCGGCNNVCNTAAGAHVSANTCSGSSCHPTCSGLFANCDNIPANGCELPVGSDKTNCGGCGVTCGSANASATSCTNGACTPTCNSGWKNCGTAAQGCNTQIGTTSNCLTCGDSCGAGFCTATGCSQHLDISHVGAPTSFGLSFSSGAPVATKPHVLSNGAGNNRIVLVGVAAPEPYTPGATVKYNGIAMLAGPSATQSENNSYAQIFYLMDAALPATAGSYSVTVTYSTSSFSGDGAFDVAEFKNVQQVNPFVTTASNGDNAECVTEGDRTATLTFAQAGTWGYAVTGARTGDTAVPNPGFLVQTMNQTLTNPTPFVAAAGYGGPLSSTSSFTWNIQNCWNSATVAVALKRVGD